MIDVVTYALLKKYVKGGAGGSSGEGGGKSAYDIAVDNGFTGTQTEWLESLKGESATISIGDDGNWYINNENTEISATDMNMVRIPSADIQSLFTNT